MHGELTDKTLSGRGKQGNKQIVQGLGHHIALGRSAVGPLQAGSLLHHPWQKRLLPTLITPQDGDSGGATVLPGGPRTAQASCPAGTHSALSFAVPQAGEGQNSALTALPDAGEAAPQGSSEGTMGNSRGRVPTARPGWRG